jgi:benzoate transport
LVSTFTGTADETGALSQSPMRIYQKCIIFLTFLLTALDGFDVLAVSFAAPGIAREWHLDKSILGIVISAGLAGMAAGSLVSGPLADLIGRRWTILANLLIMTLGMIATAFSHDSSQFYALRFATGVGIGGMVVALNPVTAEFSNKKWRVFCIGLMTIGFPIGGMLGGLAAAKLLEHYSWRAIFLAGGLFSAALLPVLIASMPESIAYLIAKQTAARRLERINAVLARCGHPLLDVAPRAPARRHTSVAGLFAADLRGVTLLMTAAYFLFFVTDFFFIGWIPQMVVDRGFTPATASSVAAFCNLGGVVGGSLLGWRSRHVGLRLLGVGACLMTALMVVIFSWARVDLIPLRLLAATVGFFLFGGIVALYAAIAQVFPATCRGSGAGLVIGIGRFGAIFAPMMSGYLFSISTPEVLVATVMALGAVSAAVCLSRLPLHKPG